MHACQGEPIMHRINFGSNFGDVDNLAASFVAILLIKRNPYPVLSTPDGLPRKIDKASLAAM